MYALIHFEPRYLAPFIVVFLLGLFFSVRLPESDESHRLCAAVAILVFAMFLNPIGSPSLNVKAFTRDILGRPQVNVNSPQAVVQGMYQMGLRAGDRIASLQCSLYGMSTWARLARVTIVSEVYYWPDVPQTAANDFWKADPATREKLIHALSETGARFIVSQEGPPVGGEPGWQQVGDTQFYAYQVHSAGLNSASK